MNYVKRISCTCLAMALIAGMSHSAMAQSTVDDATITSKVKVALVENPATKARQINVDTRNGIVQLNGFVESSEAKSEAENAARTVSGVKSVENNLQVRNGERTMGNALSDAEVTTKVKAALIADSRTKAYQIEVTTYKGIVSLGGFVSSTAEKDAAENVAKNVNGVVKVENGLKVGR